MDDKLPETPAYVYDLAQVRANQAALVRALPAKSILYYSLKANPHPDLLAEIRTGGARAEVCSAGELDAALAAGWPPDEVLYTGPGKRDQDLAHAIASGIRRFSVDSVTGLDQLDRIAAIHGVEVRCLLRINDDQPSPGQGLAMTGVASQFGADTSWVLAEPEKFASRPHVTVSGLHLYMGTNLTTVDDLVAQFQRSLDTGVRLCEVLRKHGADMHMLDLGGGFGAPFARAGEAVDLTGLRDELDRMLSGHDLTIAFESGRYLAGTAGTLYTTVLDVKQSHGKRVLVLDSGINHLGGMSGLRRLPPLVPDVRSPGDDLTDAMLAGPLCTPLDLWARSAPVPDVRPGDVLAIPNVGAYGLYASLVAFLGHPLPIEVVVDGDAPPRISRLALTRNPTET
ncbi:type III PLP-dependent enzyme [Kibdelosporangium persicum]|uniref:Pyridoxal-dependent decarboxylase n=1 Tax=Kibdelosporangium persicum TaxID=2698649 RepID=A0ABX2F774_9PSEU|nr:type III PLP-dependent enzyme [Kibdelosporangium persicum]NRN67209.1 Pyridoxal-dependent decarboxylase [Kibdelosporangium persicum]